MRQTPGTSASIARQADTLASMQRCGRGVSGTSGVSIGGECEEDGWVDSSAVEPLPWGFPNMLASFLTSSVGLSSSGWSKSTLDEKNSPIFP